MYRRLRFVRRRLRQSTGEPERVRMGGGRRGWRLGVQPSRPPHPKQCLGQTRGKDGIGRENWLVLQNRLETRSPVFPPRPAGPGPTTGRPRHPGEGRNLLIDGPEKRCTRLQLVCIASRAPPGGVDPGQLPGARRASKGRLRPDPRSPGITGALSRKEGGSLAAGRPSRPRKGAPVRRRRRP